MIQNQSVQWKRLEQEADPQSVGFRTAPNAQTQPESGAIGCPAGPGFESGCTRSLLADLGPLPSELVIIPDGLLGYIPFDFLPQTPPAQTRQYRDWDYLIRSHTLSYAYSATLHLLSQRVPKTRQENRILAFAPSFPLNPKETFAQARQTPGALAYNKEKK